MSEFKTEVVRVTIEAHPKADRLEIARIRKYQSLVPVGQFKDGDLVAYIQEGSLVPLEVLEELGLVGRLAGPNKDRVKAVKLRGVLSQGICYPARPEWVEGQDVSAELGITKYEPPIPTNMSGELYHGGPYRTVKYDVENLKRHDDVFYEGHDLVVITEKVHGTFCCIGFLSDMLAHPEYGNVAVSSKGLGARGLVFKPNAPENDNNLYLRAARQHDVPAKLEAELQTMIDFVEEVTGAPHEDHWSLFVLGEVFGKGVQDLSYGADAGADDVGFRVFDAFVQWDSEAHERHWLDDEELSQLCESSGLQRVPVLYRGVYSDEIVEALTNGPETVSGEESHIREGVIIRFQDEIPEDERYAVRQLKSVSEAYMTRKDGTEYN